MQITVMGWVYGVWIYGYMDRREEDETRRAVGYDTQPQTDVDELFPVGKRVTHELTVSPQQQVFTTQLEPLQPHLPLHQLHQPGPRQSVPQDGDAHAFLHAQYPCGSCGS